MTQQIIISTLVDISETKITRSRDANLLEYHQQQNLNVLLQTIGLRVQPLDYKVSMDAHVDIEHMKFSDELKHENATVWHLEFHIERDLVWSKDDDELALLKEDINGIAVSSDLLNTIDFPINIFDVFNTTNILFEIK